MQVHGLALCIVLSALYSRKDRVQSTNVGRSINSTPMAYAEEVDTAGSTKRYHHRLLKCSFRPAPSAIHYLGSESPSSGRIASNVHRGKQTQGSMWALRGLLQSIVIDAYMRRKGCICLKAHAIQRKPTPHHFTSTLLTRPRGLREA